MFGCPAGTTGADVVLAHTDSTAPLAVLEKAGAYGFGQAADMAEYKPTPRLSSIIDDWAPYYIERVQADRVEAGVGRAVAAPDGRRAAVRARGAHVGAGAAAVDAHVPSTRGGELR